ncbi:MAG: hypothetical protein M0Z52_03800 [Actinomycetota bacterium]|nr:hypothetical protein [Actinomycetota bacterium]
MDISALSDDYVVEVPFGEDAFVTLRYLSREESQAIARQSMKRKWDLDKNTEIFDSIESARLIGRAVVRGWRGIVKDGQDFPCTPENCDFLMTRCHEFFKLVNETCNDIRALMKKKQGETLKNSLCTSGGA